MTRSTFDDVLEAIENLPPEEQVEVLDIARRRLAERGRRRVIDEVAQAQSEFASGALSPVTSDEILKQITS